MPARLKFGTTIDRTRFPCTSFDCETLITNGRGFPTPPNAPGNRPRTNIRNTASSFWRAWRKPEHLVLVPVSSFCEYASGKPAVPHWFALGEDRPLFAFAGLWRPWTGTRAKAEDEHELFAFLTIEPNAMVAPIHPKAMPVLLTTSEEYDTWLTAPVEKALLMVVAHGTKHDG